MCQPARRSAVSLRKCHSDSVDSITVELAPRNDDVVMNWPRSGGSARRTSQSRVDVHEDTGVWRLQDRKNLAGRQGVSGQALAIEANSGLFLRNSLHRCCLRAFPIALDFRFFSGVYRLCQRDDTQNDTRVGGYRGLSVRISSKDFHQIGVRGRQRRHLERPPTGWHLQGTSTPAPLSLTVRT